MVLSEFSNAMRTSEAVLDELTESASEARTHLVKLDQKMRQLERLLESENAASRREYRELSTSLWTTIFGGNRLELAQNGDNQDLLARLESIHDQGQARVKGVLAALMELRVNLAHLHRKVQRTPGRAQRFKGTVNHIGNIAKGVERLQQSRDRYINGGSERRRAK
jgi:septation ring formation regulator EzrA